MRLTSLQGVVYAAPRDANGNPLGFLDLGNVSALELSPSTDVVEHYESRSGQRLQDGRLITRKTMSLRLTMDEWLIDNLALGLYGTKATLASGLVTDEAAPTLADGEIYRTRYPKISNVTITDSAATPATLTQGTDYEIVSPDHGTIKFINTAGFTQPFLIDYNYAGGTQIVMFDSPAPERWLKVDAINTAENNAPVLVEVYRVLLEPIGSLQLIQNDGYGTLELSGSALYDFSKQNDPTLGQFGRVIEL